MSSRSRNTPSREKQAQDFTLPNIVKELVDAEIKYANAAAITTALFASALMTLAQMVSGNDTNTAPWGVLRFFTYSAIVLSLSGTFLSLASVGYCLGVQQFARRLILEDINSWPARIARGETLPWELLTDNVGMFRAFGIHKQFWTVRPLLSIFLIIGPLFSVLAVTMWIWLTETYANAGSTMITIVPAVLGILYTVFFDTGLFIPWMLWHSYPLVSQLHYATEFGEVGQKSANQVSAYSQPPLALTISTMASANKPSGPGPGPGTKLNLNAGNNNNSNKNSQPSAKKAPVPRPNKIARPDVDEVNRSAEGFLQMYYDFMDAPLRNANIVKMYRDTSIMLWNGQSFTGVEKIKDFIASIPESKHEIQSWDCHPIPGYTPAPILITVSGTVLHGTMPAKIPPNKKPGTLPRVFSQTFVLAPEAATDAATIAPGTSAAGAAEGIMFYIRTDTLRFVG